MTATYQGTTKEEIQNRINYVENLLLSNEMEVWQAREYQSVLDEYKNQIDLINENQELLNSL